MLASPGRASALSAAGRGFLRRCAGVLAALALSATLLFYATDVLPGDAATARLGVNATAANVAALREEMNLDRSSIARFADWVRNVAGGDLGLSLVSRDAVAEMLAGPLRNTAIIGGIAFVLIAALSIAIALAAGSRPGSKLDTGISTAALTLTALPEFVVGAFLASVLAWTLRLVPPISLVPAGATPLDRPSSLVLPVLTITITGCAWAVRLVRGAVTDAADAPHVHAARLAGLRPGRVLCRHLLPTAAPVVAQALAALSVYVVAGTIVVERVFGYPGIGSLLVGAVQNRDVPVVQASGLVIAATVFISFLAASLVGSGGARAR